MRECLDVSPPVTDGRREVMRAPDEVAAMLRLHGLGWGTRRIAAELGCNRETVQRYLAAGGWAPYRRPGRPRKLAGHGAWLAERFRRHRGNADVVRQELEAELGVRVDLRTVEREVAPLRRELEAEARTPEPPRSPADAAGSRHRASHPRRVSGPHVGVAALLYPLPAAWPEQRRALSLAVSARRGPGSWPLGQGAAGEDGTRGDEDENRRDEADRPRGR